MMRRVGWSILQRPRLWVVVLIVTYLAMGVLCGSAREAQRTLDWRLSLNDASLSDLGLDSEYTFATEENERIDQGVAAELRSLRTLLWVVPLVGALLAAARWRWESRNQDRLIETQSHLISAAEAARSVLFAALGLALAAMAVAYLINAIEPTDTMIGNFDLEWDPTGTARPYLGRAAYLVGLGVLMGASALKRPRGTYKVRVPTSASFAIGFAALALVCGSELADSAWTSTVRAFAADELAALEGEKRTYVDGESKMVLRVVQESMIQGMMGRLAHAGYSKAGDYEAELAGRSSSRRSLAVASRSIGWLSIVVALGLAWGRSRGQEAPSDP